MTPQTLTPASAAATPSGRDAVPARRNGRGWILVTLLVVGVVVLLALLTPGPSDEPLDPDSAGPSGSRAVAELLRQHGVPVTKVTHSAEALRLTRFSSTLVIVRTQWLGPDQFERIAQSTARLVLVEPDQVVVDGLELWVKPAGTGDPRTLDPGCSASAPLAAGPATGGGHFYTVLPGGNTPPEACYALPERPEAGSFIDGYMAEHHVTIIGQSQILTNEHLAEEGNAALALRALGRDEQVVWYVPDPFENGPVSAPQSIVELAPDWVPWVLRQLAIVSVIVMLWRGRRFGPLVTEPLPVIVRSAETLEGRAALYRQAHARDRAAATLRTATLRRLAKRLDLARDTSPEVAAQLIGEAAGRPPAETRTLLLGPAPTSDAALVILSRDLDDLEAALRTKG